jgi:hypothetical protein
MHVEIDGGGDFRPGLKWYLFYFVRNLRRPSRLRGSALGCGRRRDRFGRLH